MTANACDACGKKAVTSVGMYRFVPSKRKQCPLFCESCHNKVKNFVDTLIENKGIVK